MTAVSNFAHCMPFRQRAARDLKASRFVVVTDDGKIDYPGEGGTTISNKAIGRILGVLNRPVKKDEFCSVMTYPGQKMVVETGEATADALSAGALVKPMADGRVEAALAGESQTVKVGTLLGPEKAANKSNIYTSILLR